MFAARYAKKCNIRIKMPLVREIFLKIKRFWRNNTPSFYYFLQNCLREFEIFLLGRFPSIYKRRIFKGICAVVNSEEKSFEKKSCGRPNIVIEQSNLCNLNCAMCKTNESKRPKGEMSKELFEKVLAQKLSWRQHLLTLHTVGEPFMCSYLEDLFEICSKNRVYLNITTNGLLIPKYINLIRRYPGVIKFMAFSIDGASKRTYERIRRGATFETLIEGLELIKDYNKRFFERISINLQACLSRENFEEIPLFFRAFSRYFKPEEILFTFMTNLSALHDDGQYYLNNMPIDRKFYRRNWPCILLWNQIHVLNDGRVSACCRDYNGELIIGNIKKSSLLDIWHSNEYETLRQHHLKGEIDAISLCRDCQIVDERFVSLFNDYARYLFIKYGQGSDDYYLRKINLFLEFLYSCKRDTIFDEKAFKMLFSREKIYE